MSVCAAERIDYSRMEQDEGEQARALGDALWARYHPRSVVDIGAGTGLYLKTFLDAGADVLAIDNDPIVLQYATIPRELIRIEDVLSPGYEIQKHDLALCVEVAEHIPESGATALFDVLCASSDLIAFSAAVPGQPGQGHINCQPKWYWLDKFAARDFYPDEEARLWIISQIIAHAKHWLLWLTDNLVIVRRANRPKFRHHLLGLAHLPMHPEFTNCGFTQAVLKQSSMYRRLGHDVTLYAGEGSEVDCTEFVQVASKAEREATYGEYNWKSEFFRMNCGDDFHWLFYDRTIQEIERRKQPQDFILSPFGSTQKWVAEAHPDLMTVETGVGYQDVFARYRVFQSYDWMNHIYGRTGQNDGSWYDAVIPHYFDPAEFPLCEEKEDYCLYFGRLIIRKGVDVAAQVCKKMGLRLIVVGQGSLTGEYLNITDPHVTHLGSMGPRERAEIMGRARCVFMPTYYIEPFGGVSIEAQMCGTPVLSTDWGVFDENVLHGLTGYRCRSMAEFCQGVELCSSLSPRVIREWAVANYSMDRCAVMYQAYFERLHELWGDGWYSDPPFAPMMGALTKRFPGNP